MPPFDDVKSSRFTNPILVPLAEICQFFGLRLLALGGLMSTAKYKVVDMSTSSLDNTLCLVVEVDGVD